ncbi:hypothetical protein [Mycolicibacterium septicum]|uniref:hypothetical protein n=1 Tax=Mycolicibacterium septicum TaxID=98668 RepID=UPI001AF54E0D|nr:hypothetical protein [Mycolicibacterium septicum]QRY51779.1 hypothetical protein JVX95_31135 [Mycolicibacterium septicum]
MSSVGMATMSSGVVFAAAIHSTFSIGPSDMNETLDKLPEPLRSQMMAMMTQRDLEVERSRADKMREDSNTLYELRGWLRLCDDDEAGHAEFYQWACHYIFGDEMPE